MTFKHTRNGLQNAPMRHSWALAALGFGALAAVPVHANVLCEKGRGDTEIQCIAKGSTSTKTLSVTSTLEVPVTVLVTQWAGKCGKPDSLLRADSRSVPANTPLSIEFFNVGDNCRTAVFSECKYTELTGNAAGSVQKPVACGELLDVKGK